jgi:hypothetical protein
VIPLKEIFQFSIGTFRNKGVHGSGQDTRNLHKPRSSEFTLFHHKHGDHTGKKVKVLQSHYNVSPALNTFEAMIQEDERGSHSRDFPTAATCPYVGLRKPPTTSSFPTDAQQPECRLKLHTSEDCKESMEYHGKPGDITEVKCDNSRAVEMCRIVRSNNSKEIDLVCDFKHCEGEPISVGLLGSQTGVVDNWTAIWDINNLRQYLNDHVSSSKFGSSFALLKCEHRHIFQVLILPKNLRSMMSRQHQKINFNIIVEDSLSRRHFYRTLSKTALTMRNIIYNKSVPATVLEFEKVQSYDTTTRINLQRLFSGKHSHPNTDFIGIEDFFTHFKEFGYSTLFQEDSCWYDKWGSLLDLRYRTGRIKDGETRDKVWKEFVDLMKRTNRSDAIDDFGVTFLTCTVYAYLRVTNVYNPRHFPNVCFAGQHFTSFLLNYAKEYMMLNDNAVKPFLAYTHVITSHERSGHRVVNDDIALAKLLQQAAYMENTLTIFISDHGAKTTKFSSYTTQGRREVFQPLIFMIMPHAVSNKLGSKVMNALVANQKRLVGIQDLGDALRAYLNPIAPEQRGLFRFVSLNRTCEHLDLNSDVLCLCDKMDKSASNESFVVKWAAEFALGSLNNMVQDQFITDQKQKTSKSYFHGYGACQRYIGVEIGLVRHVVADEMEILTFTLYVQPFDRKTKEAFDVKVSFPVTKQGGMSLDKFTRTTSFNEYEACADTNVNPKLCTCRSGKRKNLKWQNRFMKIASSQRSFSLAPHGLVLDHPCLVIFSRNHQIQLPGGRMQNAISTYEAFNACSSVTYELTIDIKKAKDSRMSRKLPHTVTIFPRTMTFLVTVKNFWKYGVFIPRFSFVKRTLHATESVGN